MVETTEKTGEKTLSVTPTKTLTLKPRGVEQGVVRQSFSHGRTKAVVVEKVKRRTLGPSDAKAPEPAAAPEAGPAARRTAGKPATPAPAPAAAPAAKSSGVVISSGLIKSRNRTSSCTSG